MIRKNDVLLQDDERVKRHGSIIVGSILLVLTLICIWWNVCGKVDETVEVGVTQEEIESNSTIAD